jgi:hypothetical protein
MLMRIHVCGINADGIYFIFNRLAFTFLAVTVINGMHKTTHIHEHTKSEADPDVG